MKILIQRVTHAHVEVEGKKVGQIGKGILAFVGVTHTDTSKESLWLANKLINLRLFQDEEGKINKSLVDVKGEALIISQFTLYADCNEGRRPSFTKAATPEHAREIYEHFILEVKKGGIPVQTGIFAASMQVFLLNDGPVTLILEREYE